jgi:hypothetical protein
MRGFTQNELEVLFGVAKNKFSRVFNSPGLMKGPDNRYRVVTDSLEEWLILIGAKWVLDRPVAFKSASHVKNLGVDYTLIDDTTQKELYEMVLSLRGTEHVLFERIENSNWPDTELRANILVTYAMYTYLVRIAEDDRRKDPDLLDIVTGKV